MDGAGCWSFSGRRKREVLLAGWTAGVVDDTREILECCRWMHAIGGFFSFCKILLQLRSSLNGLLEVAWIASVESWCCMKML